MTVSLALTRNQIIFEALEKLRVIGVGDTPAAEDTTTASTTLNIILKSLDALEWFQFWKKSDPWALKTSSGVELYSLDEKCLWPERITVSELGAESFTETDFATHLNWDVTGDISDAGGNATYTHSTGAGTLTQIAADQATAAVALAEYLFRYTVSGAGTGPLANITAAYASMVTPLTMENGAQNTVFKSGAAPTDFVISATSESAVVGNFVLDDVSLMQLTKPEWDLNLKSIQEWAEQKDKARPGIPINAYLTRDLATPKIYLWPVPNADLCIKYWGRKKIDLFDSLSDTFDGPEEAYMLIVDLLAYRLSYKFGVAPDRRQELKGDVMDDLTLLKPTESQPVVGRSVMEQDIKSLLGSAQGTMPASGGAQ